MSTLTTKNILLVEDDPNLGQVLNDFLELEGFNVTLARDGEAGFEEFSKSKFNICLLDVMLPKMDGFSLGKKIRKKDKDIPIIFLTAKSLKEDKLKGFDLGGDDYITKPFDEDELVRRINAILKRTAVVSDVSELQYKLGNFVYNHVNLTLNISGQESRITQKEGEVLFMLLQSKNNVVRREDILVKVWGENDYFMGRSLDVFITKLRKHLKPDPQVKIENVHGVGFILSDDN
ncbi:response regulator transcription factor [Marinifilum caeruleilacunae]|uniref:Response regulator transcription factor n=1 Tax=Marinifilum caeruleilacunae TaxID=2499076 RepID=A0ABX1WXN8_9BACT|nr:response regulator transcription factor [Marinifilum caeruleilacunae]NOU60620.1 response regulator transcription factor [Marinifilum caeruleilacunae]